MEEQEQNKINKIKTLYNGFFKLSKKAWTAEKKKIPARKRQIHLYPFLESEDYLAGEIRENLVVLDFDNEEDAKKAVTFTQVLMSDDETVKANIVKTERGCHIYFKNPDQKSKGYIDKKVPAGNVCAIGLECEYKLGNSFGQTPLADYEPLILDGKMREFLNPVFAYEELTPLPFYFWHYKKRESVNGLAEGEGRNQVLSEFAVGLQRVLKSEEEVISVCRIINNFIFSVPLDDKEFLSIVRAETFDKIINKPAPDVETVADKNDFMDKKEGFDHENAARFLMRKFHMKKIGGEIYVYNDGVYKINSLRYAIVNGIRNLKTHQIREVENFLMLTNEIDVFDIQSDDLYEWVAFNDCIWSNETGAIEPYTPDRIVLFKIPVDFNPKAKAPAVDKFLDDVTDNDPKTRALLEEIGGFCMYPKNERGRTFFLIGGGGNGKSTFLDVLSAVIGGENQSSLTIAQLNSQFLLHCLAGKLINVSGELSGKYMEDTDIFKKLVTGDSIAADVKFRPEPLKFSNRAKFIFAGNGFPRASDTSKAFLQRLILIPFFVNIRGTGKEDVTIKSKLTTKEAKEYWLQLFIKGLKRVQDKGFTESEKVEALKIEYERTNNHVLEFTQELAENGIDIETIKGSDLFNDFSDWAIRNRYKTLGKKTFIAEMASLGYHSKVKRVNDIIVRVYTKEQ